MRLIDLQLQNYRKYDEAEIAFGEGLIGIIGPNGAGKSSLVEAIAWAIFGQEASRTEKQLIPRQNMPKGQACQVILTLDINRKEYRIVRQLSGTGLTSKAAVFSKENGIIQQVASGTAPTKNFLTQLLGMDKNSFFTSFFAKQQELNALSDKQPAERRKIILKMLGITNIEKALDLLRFDKRTLENKAQLLESNKSDSNFLKVRFESLNQEHKEKKKEFVKIGRALDEQKKEAAKAEKEAGRLAAKREMHMSLSMEKQKSEGDLSSAQESLQNLIELRAKLDYRGQVSNKTISNLPNLEAEIKSLTEKETILTEKIVRLEAKNQDIAGKANLAKAQLENYANNRTDLLQKMKNISDAKTDSCPFCGQSLDKKTKEEVLAHHQKETGKLEALIKQKERFIKESRLKYSEVDNKYKKLKNELSKVLKELAENKANRKQLSGIEKQLESLAQKTRNKEDRIRTLKEEITKNRQKMEKLAFDEKAFVTITAEAREKSNKLHRNELEHKDLDKELSLIASNREQVKSEIEKTKSIKQQLQELNNEKKNLAKLERLFAEFRKDLIGRIRPTLSKKAGDYLNELTDGKYWRLELDNNYDIFVYDSGEKFSIERFSGGETDLVNLCLRLAISELLTERANTDFTFLVLDEIFGSQDANRRDNILKALAKLAKKFRQLLVITHIDELKDSMESLISLKEQNGSTIIEQN